MQFGSVTLAKAYFSPAWAAGFGAWGSVTHFGGIRSPNERFAHCVAARLLAPPPPFGRGIASPMRGAHPRCLQAGTAAGQKAALIENEKEKTIRPCQG